MIARGVLAAVLVGLVVLASGTLRGRDAAADPAITGYPDSIAALGDSITRAANTGTIGDHPEQSWATGTDAGVNSLYSRLLVANPAIAGNRYNDAVSGARMTNLNGQAANAVAQGAELVVILMGANDVCTGSEASMTSVATFQAQFEAAMNTLSSGLPDSRIAVASIPDVYILWDILHDNSSAQAIWNFAGICQSLLLNPTSMAAADVQRRANVRQRNIDFNNVLQGVCATYVHCHFDNFGGFNTPFQPQHVSTLDYFHPSIAGQTLAASVGWQNAPDFSDAVAPVSSSSATFVSGNGTVTLSATDAAGVSGIEYKTTVAWQRYTSPIVLPTGTQFTWRAVDVNGNVEATNSCQVRVWGWPTGDGDCDGWPTAVQAGSKAPESFMGTDAAVVCSSTAASNDELPPDAWPPDFDDNRLATILDVSTYSSRFNAIGPNPPYAARWDFNADGRLTILDVSQYSTVFNKSCAP